MACWNDVVIGARALRDSIAGLEDTVIPLPLGVELSVIDLSNALLAASLLRKTVHYPVHWLRLLFLVFVLSVGGSTVGAMLLAFQFPRDAAWKVYNSCQLAVLWKVLKGLAFAHAIGSFGVEVSGGRVQGGRCRGWRSARACPAVPDAASWSSGRHPA
jgi:hypothetical protein